ncbi:Alpha/Beta hydrolase protein [Pisolithus sp. B1]|nr:Alpha/Beta hydrolase protein [Pisolithus sp. B1]
MASMKIVEGEADFLSGVLPLVVLHGGPGVTREYVENVSQLAYHDGIPVVLYDQLGNGLSTHLPETMGHTGFWTVQLFIDELHNLLNHLDIHGNYALLGQSWGGMLASAFAAQQPEGLNKLIIANSPASMQLWMEAAAQLRLPETLNKHEAEGTITDEAYQRATQVFYEHFLCRRVPMPEPLKSTFSWIEKDPAVYMTMNGPNEFFIMGSLKTWSIIDELHKISATTLLINGRYDPFFQRIPKVKWVQFAESAHGPHLEETERLMEVVGKFLLQGY